MMLNHRCMLRLGYAVLAQALWLCTEAPAQKPKPAPAAKASLETASLETASLETLLSQLRKTGGKAWQARATAMKAAAAKAEAQAQALRQQAKAKNATAQGEDKAAQLLATEIEKITQLRAVLGKLVFHDTSKSEDRQKLEAALAQLQKLPPTGWDARTAAMKAKATTHKKAAAKLRAASKTLAANAAAKVAAAKELGEELGKLEQLKKLVSAIKLDVLAGPPPMPAKKAPAPAVAMKTAPAKKKAMAKKNKAAKPAAAKKQPPGPAKAKPAKAKPKAAPSKPAPAQPKKPKKTQPKKAQPKKAAAPPAMPAKTPAKNPGKTPAQQAPRVEADDDLVTYADHVYPILDANCITCHDPEEAEGGLDLSSYATAMQGGSSGRTLSPGNPDGSRLYLLVSHKEKPTMPPDEPKIDKQLIETIRRWIAQGAPKDLAQAKKLATQRSVARAKAAKAAANRSKSKRIAIVMPEDLPRVRKAYPARPGALRAVAASPGAPLLAVPGFRQVLLLHQNDLRELGVLAFPFGRVETLSFSADGTVLLAAGGTSGKEGGAVLYDVRSGRELGQFGKQRDVVLSASVSPHGERVAIGGTRRRIEVFRVHDGKLLWQHKHEDWVTAAAFSANGKLLASADRKGFVQVREAANGREVHTMKAADGLLADLAFSPDSASLATAGGDRSVCIYRMRDGRRLAKQQVHSDKVLCITWRTQTRLVSGGADGRMLHWKTNGQRDPELPRLGEWIYDVAASKDGKRLFATDWQGRLAVIDAKTRKVLTRATPLAVTQ